MPEYLLKFCFFYLCCISTYGNAWGEEKLYFAIIFIIWLPERVSDTVNLSVSHQLPGDLWEVTTSPPLILSK